MRMAIDQLDKVSANLTTNLPVVDKQQQQQQQQQSLRKRSSNRSQVTAAAAAASSTSGLTKSQQIKSASNELSEPRSQQSTQTKPVASASAASAEKVLEQQQPAAATKGSSLRIMMKGKQISQALPTRPPQRLGHAGSHEPLNAAAARVMFIDNMEDTTTSRQRDDEELVARGGGGGVSPTMFFDVDNRANPNTPATHRQTTFVGIDADDDGDGDEDGLANEPNAQTETRRQSEEDAKLALAPPPPPPPPLTSLNDERLTGPKPAILASRGTLDHVQWSERPRPPVKYKTLRADTSPSGGRGAKKKAAAAAAAAKKQLTASTHLTGTSGTEAAPPSDAELERQVGQLLDEARTIAGVKRSKWSKTQLKMKKKGAVDANGNPIGGADPTVSAFVAASGGGGGGGAAAAAALATAANGFSSVAAAAAAAAAEEANKEWLVHQRVEDLISAIKSGELAREQQQSNRKILDILSTFLDKPSLAIFDRMFDEEPEPSALTPMPPPTDTRMYTLLSSKMSSLNRNIIVQFNS